MIQPNRRILGGAGAVLLVAAGAVAVSQCTADPVVETGNEEQAEEAVAPMDTLAMTPDAIRAANIAVETVQSASVRRFLLRLR